MRAPVQIVARHREPMADPRSVMQEFRFLEQKRQTGSLTPEETARHAELRDLVGFEQPLPVRGGFDVAAAAAQLRESLLPAGLRSRPPESPLPSAARPPAPVAAPPPAPEPAVPAAEPFFDPASLGQEVRPQAWNPEAPGYDPDAPYDEAAWIAAGYDPNVTYDWGETADAGQAASANTESAGTESASTESAGPEFAGGGPAVAEPPAEAAPLQFGEYDGPGEPVTATEPVEPAAPPAPPPEDGGVWIDDLGLPAAAAPPPPAPAFGEYDAPPALALGDLGEPAEGEGMETGLPGGKPLDLGEPPSGWLSDGSLDAGFELASDGSFGQDTPSQPPAPWPASEPEPGADRWESPPALDLSTPFEPVPIPAARRPAEPQPEAEPFGPLEPEETLEPLPEGQLEQEAEAPPAPGLEPLPAEPVWAPPPVDDSFEIDVPPEIAAAYDAPAAVQAKLAFDSPPPPPPVSAPVPPPRPAAAPAPVAAPTPDRKPTPMATPKATPVPERDVEPLLTPVSAGMVVSGEHRVVVHTLDGAVLRGTLTNCNLEARELELDTGAPGQPTQLGTDKIKAIFFMLAAGEQPPPAQGRRVRVAFRDGRQVAGFSPNYREGGVGFFMIPVDTRANTSRIWVYQAAVKQVTVN